MDDAFVLKYDCPKSEGPSGALEIWRLNLDFIGKWCIIQIRSPIFMGCAHITARNSPFHTDITTAAVMLYELVNIDTITVSTPSSSNPLRRGGPGAPEPGRGQAQRGHHGDGQGGCAEGLGQRRGRAGSWEMYRTIENTKLV